MRSLARQITTTSFLLAACLWLVPLGFVRASGGPLLYATDTTTQQLFVVSTTNGSTSLVGDFGVPGYMADLAYDPIRDILYGTTTLTDCLYSIDRTTGAASLIGPLGIRLMHSLAYDHLHAILYGVSVTDSALYQISMSTGQSTLIGSVGVIPGTYPQDTIHGLAYNPADQFLYASVSGPSGKGGLYRIDPNTGQGTFLFSATSLNDLAFNPETGALYGIDNSVSGRPDALYTIDLANKTTSLLGPTGLGNNLGLEFAPVPEAGTAGLFLISGSWMLLRRLRPRKLDLRRDKPVEAKSA